jgi:hypothetical protein
MTKELLLKALSFLTSIGLAVSSYFLTDTYKKMDSMRSDITELQIKASRYEGSSLSSSDFIKAREVIDSQIVATDKRVIALEENNKMIREYLSEIKQDIKEIKSKN